jgi:hypothetical protein
MYKTGWRPDSSQQHIMSNIFLSRYFKIHPEVTELLVLHMTLGAFLGVKIDNIQA